MPMFYAYKGNHKLGEEPLGTTNKMIVKDLKTVRGMRNRCWRIWGQLCPFRAYTFTNFYDDKTFKLVIEEQEHIRGDE